MTPNNSKLVLWILSIIALGLVTLLVVDIYRIRSENEETSRLLNIVSRSSEEEGSAQSLRSLQNSLSVELEELDAVILTDKNLVSAIEAIEVAGQRLGLEFEITAVDEAEDRGTLASHIRITLEAEGSWVATFSFLRAIETLPYRLILEKVTLSKGETGWRTNITLALHLFNNNE